MASESAVAGAISANDFATFTLDTPLLLLPDTLYAFDIDTAGSGFVSANGADNIDLVAGSVAFSSGSGGVPNDANLVIQNFERVFHVDLEANAIVPEPASIAIWTLLSITLAGFAYLRRGGKKK